MTVVVVSVWAMVCCATLIEVWLRLRINWRQPTNVTSTSSRERRRWLAAPSGTLLGVVVLGLGLVYGTNEVQAFVLSPSLINTLPALPIALMLIGGSLILWSQRI